MLAPLIATEWVFANVAHWLSRWYFLEVLEYVGSLSVLVGVIFWISEAGDRTQQRHYQAWQVINTAQGKGGNGGRMDALEQLAADGVSLTGVDLTDADLENLRLENAQLTRARFNTADLMGADFKGAILYQSYFHGTNIRGADLRGTNLEQSDFHVSDASGANLSGADFKDADMADANLEGIVGWESIRSIEGANIRGVVSPPKGFVEWALKHGAVETAATQK